MAAAVGKRGAAGEVVVAAPKRARTGPSTELVAAAGGAGGRERKSSLEAPIMLCEGHQDAVLTMKFAPSGGAFASGSQDREVFLWSVQGECENYSVLKGHKKAVLELHWAYGGEKLVSCSPDKTVRAWDAETGAQVKKMNEHVSFVNTCCPARRGPELVVSGSDDCTAKLWDLRVKKSVQTMNEKYQVLAVGFSDAADKIYAAGIENVVNVYDMRKGAVGMQLAGHTDTITGMDVSADGDWLLTNAMDNTLRLWDLRPYAPQDRCTKVFTGHAHNFEKNLLKCAISPDGKHVTAGSADRNVHVWNVASGEELYRLPGHLGSVNEAVFHPTEPIIGSCGSDRKIFLGELDI